MIKDILNTFWTKIASAIIALCILILTTQYLGAGGRGLLSLISSCLGVIMMFSGFVGGPAVIFLASKKKLQYLLLPIYVWSVIVSILGSLIVWFLQLIPSEYILPLAILSGISSMYSANFYVLVGKQQIRTNNIIYLCQWIVNLAAMGLFFILLNQPLVEFAVIALFFSGVCSFFLTFFEIKKMTNLAPFDLPEQILVVKSLVSFSFFAQAATLMCYLNYRVGIFFLKMFSGLFSVGIYSVGVNLAEFILLASQSIALVEYSIISNSDNLEYAKDITIQLTKLGFILTTGIMVVLLVLPPAVYGMVFGRDFSSVHPVLLTLSPGIIAFGTSIVMFNYFAGIGKNRLNAFAGFVHLFSNILLCFLLIPVFGTYGAGIAASTSFLLMAGILTGVFLRETNTRFKELIIKKSDIDYFFNKFRDRTRKN